MGLMAAGGIPLSPAPLIITNRASTTRKTNSRFVVVMCSKNQNSVDLHTRSSLKKKVFEDRTAGIVCYRDENGEITCEGYDEGPRFHHKLSRFNYNARNVYIIELLQRCWLQVSEQTKGNSDFHSNGFN